jgi:hypothetical protein
LWDIGANHDRWRGESISNQEMPQRVLVRPVSLSMTNIIDLTAVTSNEISVSKEHCMGMGGRHCML